MKKLLTIIFTLSLTSIAFGGWSGWDKIPGTASVGEPSVVVTKNGIINVMFRDKGNNALWWTRSDDGGKTWYGDQKDVKMMHVGGVLTSSPSCGEPYPNVIECYVRNTNGGVSQIDYINGAWSKWSDIGGSFPGNVSAAIPDSNVRQLFVVNQKGEVASRYWNVNGWQNWANTGAIAVQNSTGTLKPGAPISCAQATTGTATSTPKGEVPEVDTACVTVGNGSGYYLNTWLNKKTPGPEGYGMGKIASDFVPSLRIHNVGSTLEVFFVGKDKQMRRGIFEFGKGWKGEFETIGNGLFSSGPSCDQGGKGFKAVCAGRGLDNEIWFSKWDGSAASAQKPNEFPNPPTDVQTGKVLFNAGNAGSDINAMYARPSGGPGIPLKIKVSDAKQCYGTGKSCIFNLGVLLVRNNAAGAQTVEVKMTNGSKLPSGALVGYTNIGKFEKGVKTSATSVPVELEVDKTTTVTVSVGNETFKVNVVVTK